MVHLIAKMTLGFMCLMMLVMTGCSVEGDMLWVHHKGSKMPVWVRGQVDSGTFLLHIHGGPGFNAFENTGYPAYQKLEKQIAVVYWDQRHSGSSRGTVDDGTLNLEQFVEDLDIVIDLLKKQYKPKRLILLGHSWGGTLGTAYLIQKGSAKVNGWIELTGGHNISGAMENSRKWLTDRAKENIKAGRSIAFWQEALDWMKKNPKTTGKLFKDYAEWIFRAGGYTYNPAHNPDTVEGWDVDATPAGPRDMWGELFNSLYISTGGLDATGINLVPKMGKIKLPTLIMWGRHDGIIPVSHAQEAYDAIGTPKSKKRLVIFEKSGHTVSTEEPERFYNTVMAFIKSIP